MATYSTLTPVQPSTTTPGAVLPPFWSSPTGKAALCALFFSLGGTIGSAFAAARTAETAARVAYLVLSLIGATFGLTFLQEALKAQKPDQTRLDPHSYLDRGLQESLGRICQLFSAATEKILAALTAALAASVASAMMNPAHRLV